MPSKTSKNRIGARIALMTVALTTAGLSVTGQAAATPAPPVCLTPAAFVSDNSAFGNNNGGLIKVGINGGHKSSFSESNSPVGGPLFETPWGMTRDDQGDILVAEQSIVPGAASAGIIRVDDRTGARTLVSDNANPAGGPDFVAPSSVAVEPGGTLVAVDLAAFADGNGGVIRVDPTTGARTRVSSNANPAAGPQFDGPMDIAVADNGDIFVADAFGAKIIKVDPVTGARSLVSRNNNPAGGPLFDFPWSLTIDSAGDLLVSDSNAFGGGGGIIRVDPGTGARTTVSSNAVGAGPLFGHPGDLVVSSSGRIYLAHQGPSGVYSVDPSTGDRSIVSDNASPGSPAFAWPHGIVLACEPRVQGPPVDVPTTTL